MPTSRTAWLGVIAFAGAAALVAFAEPTPTSTAIGGAVLTAGAALRVVASAYESDEPAASRRGPFAHVRNPALLAALLAGAGLVLLAASDGPRGRWVPRTVAPLGLLLFFGDVLPRADARIREAVRAFERDHVEGYLARVPALVPRARAFGDPQWRSGSARRALAMRTLVTVGAWLAIALLCVMRPRWTDALGF